MFDYQAIKERLTHRADDEKLIYSEVDFLDRFTLIVNVVLLIYSLVCGSHALLGDSYIMVWLHFSFTAMFVFFVVFKNRMSIYSTAMNIDRIVIFLYFLAAFIANSILGFAGMSSVVYAFIAMVLHGRRMGTNLSVALLVLEIVYVVLVTSDVIPLEMRYAPSELASIFGVQAVCIFIYYVALRWYSMHVYERMSEIDMLNEDKQMRDEKINMLTAGLRSDVKNIIDLSDGLFKSRLNPKQYETVMLLKASGENLLEQVDSVIIAQSFNIRPVRQEIRTFSIQNVVTNILMFFHSRAGRKIHSLNTAPNVPHKVRGNEELTRQAFLSLFNAIDRKIGMEKVSFDIKITFNDAIDEKVYLDIEIKSKTKVSVDGLVAHLSSESIIHLMKMEYIQRLVESMNGHMEADFEGEKFDIVLTLVFDEYNDMDASLYKEQEDILQMTKMFDTIKLEDVRLLVVDNDTSCCTQIVKALAHMVKDIAVASNRREALHKFDSGHFDLMIVNFSDSVVQGFQFVRDVRASEATFAIEVPIIALTDEATEEDRSMHLDMVNGGYLTKPFSNDQLIQLVQICMGE